MLQADTQSSPDLHGMRLLQKGYLSPAPLPYIISVYSYFNMVLSYIKLYTKVKSEKMKISKNLKQIFLIASNPLQYAELNDILIYAWIFKTVKFNQ